MGRAGRVLGSVEGMRRSTPGLVLAALLAACTEAKEPAPPPAPKWPTPPSPELPMTPAKAREIIGDLPMPCIQMATWKIEQATCDARQNKPVDQEALRTELRDLRWRLQQKTPEEASAACEVQLAEMGKKPKPAVCWDLGTT